MSRYIDADKMIDGYSTTFPYDLSYCDDGDLMEWLNAQPTADVVEVVRCKDCVHWGGATYGFVCRKFSGIETKICMGADHYCSYGERKEK